MKKVKKSRSSGSSIISSLDSFSEPEIMAMTREEFDSHCRGKGGTATPAGTPAVRSGCKPGSPDLSQARELALVKVGTEVGEQEQRRSKKGAEAILAGHTAERLRRSGSTLGESRASQLEEIAQTATQSEDVKVACGEVIRAGESFPLGLRNTLEYPTVMAADASEHRSRLAAGADVLELALDAATTIGAQNSLEKMQAHQLALAHKMAMHFGGLALEEKDVVLACKLEKASMAAMRSYQQGQDSFHRGRRGGGQIVTVQRVNVNEGGQAVIAGHVNEPAA